MTVGAAFISKQDRAGLFSSLAGGKEAVRGKRKAKKEDRQQRDAADA